MKTVLAALLTLVATSALASEYVNGYFKSDGTYVPPHYRSSPNSTTLDNYSTRGNVNPYTGQEGTKNPYNYSTPSSSGYRSSPSYQGYQSYPSYQNYPSYQSYQGYRYK